LLEIDYQLTWVIRPATAPGEASNEDLTPHASLTCPPKTEPV
jgi:hypothetical protein